MVLRPQNKFSRTQSHQFHETAFTTRQSLYRITLVELISPHLNLTPKYRITFEKQQIRPIRTNFLNEITSTVRVWYPWPYQRTLYPSSPKLRCLARLYLRKQGEIHGATSKRPRRFRESNLPGELRIWGTDMLTNNALRDKMDDWEYVGASGGTDEWTDRSGIDGLAPLLQHVDEGRFSCPVSDEVMDDHFLIWFGSTTDSAICA